MRRKATSTASTTKVVCGKEEAKAIFAEFHSSSIGAHCGQRKTRDAISARFYWPGMSSEIDSWVNILNVFFNTIPNSSLFKWRSYTFLYFNILNIAVLIKVAQCVPCQANTTTIKREVEYIPITVCFLFYYAPNTTCVLYVSTIIMSHNDWCDVSLLNIWHLNKIWKPNITREIFLSFIHFF